MPLCWLSLAFLTGILFGNLSTLPISTWLILAGGALALALLRPTLQRSIQPPLLFQSPVPLPILCLAFTLGAARFQGSLPDVNDPGFVAFYNDKSQPLTITGTISQMPDVRDSYINLRVEVESIAIPGDEAPVPVRGAMLARTYPEGEVHYGDRLALTGFLQTPPEHEDFSYRDYLARQGIYGYLPRAHIEVLDTNQGNPLLAAVYSGKEKALSTVYRLWPDPEASLFAGILLGVESGIPEPVREAFQETGTSHIIAISGFNITIVAGLFATFFGRLLDPRRGAVAAAFGIAIYTLLVGADAAVVRAAIMGGLSLFARQVGRRQHGLNTLAFTAALMALINPHTLWDVGFQLSFAATLGLILYADPMSKGFIRFASRALPPKTAQRLAGPVGEYLLFTLAAQITTLPITAYHFGRISWSAFLANPVILPVQPPIMTIGGLAVILGLIWFPLGELVAPLAWPFLLFTIRSVEWFAKTFQGVLILGDFSLFWVLLFYGILLTWTFEGSRFRSWISARSERLQTALAMPLLTALGVSTVILWRAVLAAPDGRLHLVVLDVGTGDALLIQTPAGRYLLINGGPSTSRLANGLGRRLPPFHRQLDWLVVAAPRSEQIGALPRLLERYPPDQVLWAGVASPARAADYLRESLTHLQIPIHRATPGMALDLGAGASLNVLTAGKRGAILLLQWSDFRAVLPLGVSAGDLESLRLGKDIGQVGVLLLADNGYAPTNPPEWISNLRPQVVLLSVAPDDRDGLPDQSTLNTLAGYTLLRTDRNGWIHISTDGVQIWVAVERK